MGWFSCVTTFRITPDEAALEVAPSKPVSTFEATRLIVVPVIRDPEERILLCRMAPDRGVFPGQWALPGGGVEPGETLEAALDREVHEELGARVVAADPLFFKDGVFEKTFPDGIRRSIYMVFLLFDCSIADEPIRLNEEFVEYKWAAPPDLLALDLNVATVDTFERLGLLSGPAVVDVLQRKDFR
jgi:nucleoside triphosphatase